VSPLRRLALTCAVTTVGWGLASLLGLDDYYQSSFYLLSATALLAVGLFASTHEIEIHEARRNARLILTAVTVGVLAKAALISVVMYFVFDLLDWEWQPAYLVLGVALAQIDPLSVAALQDQSRLSKSAKAILFTWASFDDPVTSVLVIYMSAFTLTLIDTSAGTSGLPIDRDLPLLAVDLLANLVFALGAYLCWRTLRMAARRGRRVTLPRWAPIGVLLALAAFAVWQFLMLGVAIMGLFYRLPIDKALRRVVATAFLIAAFALGLPLAAEVNWGAGLVLGAAAYFAQLVVGLLLSWRQKPRDRLYLALAQQNGITAIILALLLETSFAGTVAIIAPAILTVNVLHLIANASVNRWMDRRGAPIPKPAKPETTPPAIATGASPTQLTQQPVGDPAAIPGPSLRQARTNPPLGSS
jgi:NhaP-type Na+/H+ or K+/H+ antiporter